MISGMHSFGDVSEVAIPTKSSGFSMEATLSDIATVTSGKRVGKC